MAEKTYKPWEVMKWLLQQVKPYWFYFLLIALLSFGSSLCSLGITEGLRRLVNAAQIKSRIEVWEAFYFSLTVVLVGLCVNFLSTYLRAVVNHNSIYWQQKNFFKHLIQLKQKHLEKYHSGDLFTRLDSSAYVAQDGMNNKMIDILQNAFTIILLSFYLSHLNVTLTLISLTLAISLPLLILPISGRLRKAYDKVYSTKAKINADATDIVQGTETVRSFSLQKRLLNNIRHLYDETYHFSKKSYRLSFLTFHIQNFVVIGGILVILGYGGVLVIRGVLDVGSVVAFLVSFEQLIFPISRLANSWSELQGTLSQGQRVREVMLLPTEEDLALIDSEKKNENGIIFDNISFSYTSGKEVLSKVSFIAKPDQVTAFAGPSGSGKSTIIKLLMKIYEPDSGVIRYNGMDINNTSLINWRAKIAYVAQDSPIFTGTVAENLRISKENATEDEMWQALKAANLDDLIKSLPDGLETLLGEKGTGLSGGEKQRLTIARALLGNPEILLLDEATSSLDNENERLVKEALEKLMRGRTTLVVAHRFSTIEKAAQIIYLEEGKILEQGTYYELMALEGRFSQMATSENQELVTPVAKVGV